MGFLEQVSNYQEDPLGSEQCRRLAPSGHKLKPKGNNQINDSLWTLSYMLSELTVKHGVEVRAYRRQHHPVGVNGINAYLEHHVTQLKQKKRAGFNTKCRPASPGEAEEQHSVFNYGLLPVLLHLATLSVDKDDIASNNGEWLEIESMWKETAVVFFEALSQHLPG
jgi:hypothetical protein